MQMGESAYFLLNCSVINEHSTLLIEERPAPLRQITERRCLMEPDNRRDRPFQAIGQMPLHRQVQCMEHRLLRQ